ncbi:MAG: hypothetical protein ACPG7E_08205, partial [Marinirhabdus sp.]
SGTAETAPPAPLAAIRTTLKQMAAHNGSVDDAVDDAPCFSIDYPYSIFFNGEPYAVVPSAGPKPIPGEDIVKIITPPEIAKKQLRPPRVGKIGSPEAGPRDCSNKKFMIFWLV